MNLGNDELSRPVTSDAISSAPVLKAKLALLASIVGPQQRHLEDCLRLATIQTENLDHYRKQCDTLRTALSDMVRPEIRVLIEKAFDERADSLVTMDEVRDEITDTLRSKTADFLHSDNLAEHIADEINSSRRIRAEIEDIVDNHIDIDDIRSDIERDLDIDDKIQTAIDNFDFGDILDDHTRDIDEKIVKRLVDEITDDSKHPLVNAVLNALVLRIGNA